MKKLTIREATELYTMLGSYIPALGEIDDDLLSFGGKIIDRIVEDNKHELYVDAVMLMSGKTLEELQEMDTNEMLSLFLSGLVENNILFMQEITVDNQLDREWEWSLSELAYPYMSSSLLR